MKKYELTTETKVWFGRTLYRIRALVAFGDVEVGELGGWIEKEANLNQEGNAWVSDDARVSDNACVSDDARVSGSAEISGNAEVCGDAQVYGNAWVSDNALVCGNARVSDNAWVFGSAEIAGNAEVCGNARVCGNAEVFGNAEVCGDARVFGSTWVYGNAEVMKPTHLFQLGAIGSRDGFTTFFRTKDKQIFVSCGCFRGSITAFAEKVKQTHGDSKHAKTYALAIELAKMQIEDVEE